jgi:predicted dehydrogenase
VKVSLIGCGEIAPDNAAGLRASSSCELGPVMDLNEEASGSLAREFDVASTTSLDEILEDDSVDAVVIAVPHHLHADVTIRAAEAGKHVIVEKPLATSLADADAMIEACGRAGVALSVLFSYRYEPIVMRAKQLIDDGAVGTVTGTHIQFMTEKPVRYWAQGYKGRVQSDWRGSWAQAGGGVLMMNVCHMLDYFAFITGLEPARIYSTYSTEFSPVEVEDSISVTIGYAGGAIGSVHASSLARGERWRSEERIWGTHGSMQLSPDPRIYTMRAIRHLKPARWQKIRHLPASTRVATFFDRLAESVARGEEPEVTGLDGRRNLELILGAYEAARTGTAVEFDGRDETTG